ncbi:MAG: hypothetical protein UZ15_CFX003002779 [Chloroflexi bacterium OLB15]|nr:MAG: hypothetical protein UZ15_CFX003002779 [Chloroflexi bacterium OLB15]
MNLLSDLIDMLYYLVLCSARSFETRDIMRQHISSFGYYYYYFSGHIVEVGELRAAR